MDADENWKRIRSIVSPAFTSGKLRAMCLPIENITDKLIDNLQPFAKSGNEFDIRTLLDGFTMDVISRCAYGIELDSMNQPNHPGEFNSTVSQPLKQLFLILFNRFSYRKCKESVKHQRWSNAITLWSISGHRKITEFILFRFEFN